MTDAQIIKRLKRDYCLNGTEYIHIRSLPSIIQFLLNELKYRDANRPGTT